MKALKNEIKMTFEMKKTTTTTTTKCNYVLNQFYIARRTKKSSFIHVRPGIHSFSHVRSALKKVYNI